MIEKIARENGGSVVKKYNPEFNAHEITGVSIGNLDLEKSHEGIHFYVSQSGIPFISTGGQIVFPNADELRGTIKDLVPFEMPKVGSVMEMDQGSSKVVTGRFDPLVHTIFVIADRKML